MENDTVLSTSSKPDMFSLVYTLFHILVIVVLSLQMSMIINTHHWTQTLYNSFSIATMKSRNPAKQIMEKYNLVFEKQFTRWSIALDYDYDSDPYLQMTCFIYKCKLYMKKIYMIMKWSKWSTVISDSSHIVASLKYHIFWQLWKKITLGRISHYVHM